MDEHVGLLEAHVRALASKILDAGDSGDFATKFRTHYQLVTLKGLVLDVTATVNIAAKPARKQPSRVTLGPLRRES